MFIELGVIIISLALLTRLAHRIGFSAIPLYLLAGLAFGKGGLFPLQVSEEFMHLGSEIGVLLLLFALGLEYKGEQLSTSLRTELPAGIVDFIFNFPPGFILGLILGWGPLAAWILGGVTYISSSAMVAKVLTEQGWMENLETPVVICILVLEDLAMALYLPLTAVLLAGQELGTATVSVLIALVTVGALFFAALHYGKALGRLIAHKSDQVILFSVFGLLLVVAGVTEWLQVSAPVGAFLLGVALPEEIVERVSKIFSPLHDLFAAFFFLFFGLQVDPATLPPFLLPAAGLGIATVVTKFAAGWWAAHRDHVGHLGCSRAGTLLAVHGEFSIVIAGVGVTAGLTPQLGALTTAYVLFLAILGPILLHFVEPLDIALTKRKVVLDSEVGA
ncbi:MAG: cation:proton antiporter [Anaerolineales bacterium]